VNFSKIEASILLAVLFVSNIAISQIILSPSGNNQKSFVSQNMGLVKVSISYSSPDVHDDKGNNRTGKIWGDVVPYGYFNMYFGLSSEENPSPWRAGTNENTSIEFSHAVLVKGKNIKAGKYGFFIAPAQEGDWEVILSKNSTSWGSYFYEPEDVAYRFSASPKENEFTKFLTYEFTERKLESCIVELQWEKIALPLKIEVEDVYGLYVEQIRNELKNYAGFEYASWAQAASFCADQKINLDEALEWANHAIEGKWVGQKNYTTYLTKARVLKAAGKDDEAKVFFEKAIFHPTAVIFDVHGLGRKYISVGEIDLAFDIFQWNAKAHPKQWPINVGLMRGYSAKGDYKSALEYCKKAQKNVDPEDDLNVKSLKKLQTLLEEGKDVN